MTAIKKKSPEPAAGNTAPVRKKSSAGLVITMIGAFVLVAAAVVLMNVGSLVKVTVEKIASDTLGVPVTLATLEMNPAEKTVIVTGLNVGNPPGFTKPVSFTIGKIGITAESFSPALLVFEKIDVESTDINLEIVENATNLSMLSSSANKQAAAPDTAAAQQVQPPKVIIRQLVFNGMTLNSSAVTGGDLPAISVSGLHMTGIGEKENGVLASEAITQVLETVTRTAMQGSLQAGYLQSMSPAALDGIRNQFGLAETFKEQAKQGFENLKSGIRNLFGGAESEAPAPATPAEEPAPAQP